MKVVKVSIPANAEYLHLLRSVIASIGALSDAPIDVIDDLRISVDEACSQLLSSGSSASRLTLDVLARSPDVEVVATIDAAVDVVRWPPPGAEDTLAWQVLRALADRSSFERTEEGVAIRFVKRLQE